MYTLCIMFFFFFKQKTAYEMRISDWSSDVCSSDLTDEVKQFHEEPGDAGAEGGEAATAGAKSRTRNGRVTGNGRLRVNGAASWRRERKSVVEGKSVSVRVDIGGRRIMNKKTRNKEAICRSRYRQSQMFKRHP